MKNRQKINLSKLFTLILVVPLFFFTCQKEEGIQEQSSIKTVSINDALDFLNINNSENNLNRNANTNYLMDISTDVLQEEIINSNELLTVVPASTIYDAFDSRILLLEIEGEIQSVVFSMLPNLNANTDEFSGEIMITDLEGAFLKGYRAFNGTIVSEFKEEFNEESSSYANRSSGAVCSSHGNCSVMEIQCMVCLTQLDEVVVVGSAPRVTNLQLYSLYDYLDGGNSGWIGIGWDSGNSGGGGSGGTVTITSYQSFLNGLSAEQLNFLNLTQNISLKISIQEFFSENGHTTANENFISDLLTYLRFNPNSGFELANFPVNNAALSFANFSEAQEYFDNLIKDDYTHISSTFEAGSIRRDLHSIKFNDFPQADIVTSIKAMIPDNNNALECLDILHVRSILEGNNTLFDWTQLDSEDPNANDGPLVEINETLDSVKISIEGEMLVGLNLGGYPVRKRDLITVVITYNYSTAEIDEDYCYWYYTNN